MDGTAELLLAIGLMLVVGIAVFAHRKSRFKADVEKLTEEERRSQPQVSAFDGHAQIVIKCVSYGKYQIEGGEWFNAEHTSVRTEQSDVLGGVCPNCRIRSNI